MYLTMFAKANIILIEGMTRYTYELLDPIKTWTVFCCTFGIKKQLLVVCRNAGPFSKSSHSWCKKEYMGHRSSAELR